MSDLVARLSPYHDGSMQFDNDGGWVSFDDYMIAAKQITALQAELADARNNALDDAVQAVHEECWTDGEDNEITRAEQNTVTLAIRAIRALKGE